MPQRFGGPTKARPVRPRLRGAACRRLQRLLGRDRLRSVGSVRSQADEACHHAGDRGFRERAGYHRTRTTRCPSMGCRPCSGLDPPSRCKNVSCLCFGLGLAAGAGEVQRAAREACAQRVYATNSSPRKSKKPSRGAAGLWPGRRCSVDAGGGSRAAETRAAGETGSDEPRCT